MAGVSDSKVNPDLIYELAHGLRQVARECAADGKPEVGAAYLRQALALLPGEAAHEVLLDLAELETTYDMRSAAEHFGVLLTDAGDIEVVAEAASALLALYPSLRDERVWTIARDAIAACADHDLRLKLLARIAAAAVLTVNAGDWRDEVLSELGANGTVTAGEKAALGVTAFFDLWRGRPLAEVQQSAEALFWDNWVASLRGSGACYWLGMVALVMTDSPLAPQAFDEALAYARRQSSRGAEGGTLVLRAHARLRAGDLAGAVADGRAAYETVKAYGGGPVLLAHALAALVEAERERGEIGAATEALSQSPSDDEAGTLGLVGIRLARARVRATAGASVAALDELLYFGSVYESIGGGSPALLPWRSDAALLAQRIGRDVLALELADAEVAAAADAGPRALGRALAARAAVGPTADVFVTAMEAVRQLERVDAPLELTRALIVLGRVIAAEESPKEARKIFARALELAERAQARPLAAEARDGLVSVGGRPRRAAAVGVDGLTPAERTVAQAAANGLSNREIAAALHMAPSTVKRQLTSVYRKLAVSSRAQLAQALGER